MSRKQIYKTPKRKCSRCLYERTDTEKVSERIWPPAGGYLCPECLVPAAIQALKAHKVRPDRPAKDDRPSITCPECGLTSYDADDIKLKFCKNCDWFTSDPRMRHVKKEDRV